MNNRVFSTAEMAEIWGIPKVGPLVWERKFHIEADPVREIIYRNAQCIPVVIDIQHLRPSYLGLDPVQWCGWEAGELYENGLQSYLERVHPDDLLVHELASHYFSAYLERAGTIAERLQVKSAVTYRFRHKDGRYIHLLQISQPTEFTPEGRLRTVLTVLRDITDAYEPGVRYLRFYGADGREEFLCIEKNRPQWLPELSERERAVVRGLVKGQSSQQIADELFISKHTVDTHRRNILQKLRVDDTTALCRLVSLFGLLEAEPVAAGMQVA